MFLSVRCRCFCIVTHFFACKCLPIPDLGSSHDSLCSLSSCVASWLVSLACHGQPSSNRCLAGVAGYTWVAILHVWLGLTFKTTLLSANITSVAWLCIYHGVLPAPKAQAVSQLHTLHSRDSISAEHSQADVHGPAEMSSDAVQDLEGSTSHISQVSTSLLRSLWSL